MIEIWQDYDCPGSGLDFDLVDSDVVVLGARFYCSGCGKDHVAGDDVRLQTYAVDERRRMRFPPMPTSAEQLEAWRAGDFGDADPFAIPNDCDPEPEE